MGKASRVFLAALDQEATKESAPRRRSLFRRYRIRSRKSIPLLKEVAALPLPQARRRLFYMGQAQGNAAFAKFTHRQSG